MTRTRSKPVFVLAAALALAAAGQASAATKEVTLASPSQALTYCQSGGMPGNDIAYIAGAPGLAQYGQGDDCQQQVPPKKTVVTKSIQVVGSAVSECKLQSTKKSVAFCQSGAMGEWDIDYIAGRTGKTLSGPGYGCVVNFSTSSIGNAICK